VASSLLLSTKSLYSGKQSNQEGREQLTSMGMNEDAWRWRSWSLVIPSAESWGSGEARRRRGRGGGSGEAAAGDHIGGHLDWDGTMGGKVGETTETSCLLLGRRQADKRNPEEHGPNLDRHKWLTAAHGLKRVRTDFFPFCCQEGTWAKLFKYAWNQL
jgi:hypothetical protein